MAIGFGPGADMMSSYNANRKKLGSKKSLKDVSDGYKGKGSNSELQFKKMSGEELKAFKEKLCIQKEKDKKRNIIIISVVAVISIVGLYLFVQIFK